MSNMAATLKEFIQETHILEAIQSPHNNIIMVIGGSDTGKTTLIECLADLLSRQTEIGVVDLDMGQSHIGLPTTIAWGKIKGGFKGWTSIQVEDFYFTGTLTPVGNLLPVITGAKIIMDKAIASCQKLIIDTTGLIAEPAGRVLKQFKIEILSPDVILTLEHANELEYIFNSYKNQKFLKIFRLTVPEGVTSKSMTKRSQYRFERFRNYFKGARTFEVLIEDISIRFTRSLMRLSTVEMKNRVISFRDKNNQDIALGIIKRANFRDKKFLVYSPIRPETKFSAIIIGTVQIEL
jgi:polynucleotide 5'-kinase involved in rRNA processing